MRQCDERYCDGFGIGRNDNTVLKWYNDHCREIGCTHAEDKVLFFVETVETYFTSLGCNGGLLDNCLRQGYCCYDVKIVQKYLLEIYVVFWQFFSPENLKICWRFTLYFDSFL